MLGRLWSIVVPVVRLASLSLMLGAFILAVLAICIINFNYKYCAEQCPPHISFMGSLPYSSCFTSCFAEPLFTALALLIGAIILVVLTVEAWRWRPERPEERVEVLRDVRALEDKMPFQIAEILPAVRRRLPFKLYRELLERIEEALRDEYENGYQNGAIDYGTHENFSPREEVLHMWPP